MTTLRDNIEELIRAERVGFFQHLALYALSLAYGAVVRLRLLLYRASVLKTRDLPCRVISIGNITAGGTGKTPVTMLIAGFLSSLGRRVVILSRGYNRKSSGLAMVSDGKSVLLGPEEAGDEPYLMAERLNGVPVIVGPDRVASGLYAVERFSPEFIVLDDGFQHIRLGRDLNILLVDGATGFGNGYLLPRGILREPVGSVKRADALMIKDSGKDSTALKLEELNVPLFRFGYRVDGLFDVRTGARMEPRELEGRKVVAVSAIADPSSFVRTLEGLGAVVASRLSFRDHHYYTEGDVEEIARALEGADLAVTTEKDACKLRGLTGDMPVYALRVAVDLPEADLKRLLGMDTGKGDGGSL